MACRAAMVVLLMLLGLIAARAALAGSLHGLSLTGAPATSSGEWRVSVSAAPGGGVIYPGHSSERLLYTVTRVGQTRATPHLRASVVADPATGGARDPSGAVIPGCLARWFAVAPVTGATWLHIPRGSTSQGWLRLTMIDAPVNQDACRGSRVAVKLSVS